MAVKLSHANVLTSSTQNLVTQPGQRVCKVVASNLGITGLGLEKDIGM